MARSKLARRPTRPSRLDLAPLLRLPPDHHFAAAGAAIRQVILADLEWTQNVSESARRLGISHRSLARMRAEGLLL